MKFRRKNAKKNTKIFISFAIFWPISLFSTNVFEEYFSVGSPGHRRSACSISEWSRAHPQPIRGQHPGRVITLSQSEAAVAASGHEPICPP